MIALSTRNLLLLVAGAAVLLFAFLRFGSHNEKAKSNTSLNKFVILGILLFGALLVYKYRSAILSRIYYFQDGSYSYTGSRAFIYDTDWKNNEYIKGDLSTYELRRLDKILMEEKRNGGLRLSSQRLHQLARNNNDIIEAYDRWRKCKDMYRTFYHSVYPDERSGALHEIR
ncbi:MAG: hypothetical protein ONB12_03940 [candidate division KSB1 bacterium]|nr:hypothetical protein [candidate division KSB1 bacterium]